MSDDDRIWGDRIAHILQAITEIGDFIAGHSFETFLADVKTVRAVERNIEIIGEASAKIPDGVKKKYPKIPWGGMKGMRNAISHGYDQVEYEAIWDVAHGRLKELKQLLLQIELPENG